MKHPLVAVPLILVWACGGSSSPSPTAPSAQPPAPATPTIQVFRITAPPTMETGATVQLSALTLLSDGTAQTVTADRVTWQVSNTTVAAISATGVLSALQAGVVDVRGSYQQLTSEAASVTVAASNESGVGWWDY
jgi:hypothetical protein